MSKQQGRVVQMSEDEAARLRGARKVVDAEVVDGSERRGAPQQPAGPVARAVGAVVDGARAVGRAAGAAAAAVKSDQAKAAGKAVAVAAVGWAVEAAKDGLRREVQRRVGGVFAPPVTDKPQR